MAFFTFTRVVVVLAFFYLAYNFYVIYGIFNPPQCDPKQPQKCIFPAYTRDKKLELWVFTSTRNEPLSTAKTLELVFRKKDLVRTDEFKVNITVSLPRSTLQNGSLYAHVYLGPKGKSPLHHSDVSSLSVSVVPLTKYSIPKSSTFNLLTSSGTENDTSTKKLVTHWIPWLTAHSLAEDFQFNVQNIPQDLWKTLRVIQTVPMQYLPILYVDRLRVRDKDLMFLSEVNTTVPLELSYSPVGIGYLRLWLIFEQAMITMRTLGFADKEFDDIKGIFLDTSFWLFGLTVFITVFHLLFDFLAFKNDISFWRHRKTMVGLSSRTIIWRFFSQTVVFLYLMDEKTSLLVLIPAGIGTVIEFWKVLKAFKIRITWEGLLPRIERGEKLKAEIETESYDSEAMHKLSYLLYPLVIAGAVYQLIYSSYRSWYSWVIHSLVNGVYAFGFLFMLPQLFLNYKLKSVAHLPWRAFMYKAFNTFIDDVFAFIITMPTSHRIAVFRDDLVFVVYLYQRWLYPVDRNRVNEYGESFEEPVKEHQD